MPKKPKACSSNLNIKKFQALISKWDVLIQNDQMLWIVKKPNEKLQKYVIIFLWEVLVVYDLIELIIEVLF